MALLWAFFLEADAAAHWFKGVFWVYFRGGAFEEFFGRFLREIFAA